LIPLKTLRNREWLWIRLKRRELSEKRRFLYGFGKIDQKDELA